jgi:hypothetical protein
MCLILGAGVFLAPRAAHAQTVPLKMQAVMLKKLLLFDRTLNGTPKVALLCDDAAMADAVKTAFSEVGLTVATVKSSQLDSLSAHNAVYIAGTPTKEAKDAALKYKLLSMTGGGDSVRAGDAGVGVEFKDGKINIVVNQTTVKKHGHDLSADFLAIVTLVK